MKKAIAVPKRPAPGKKPMWRLCLYVAGTSPRSLTAYSNLKTFCQEQMNQEYALEVVDVIAHPEEAKAQNIVALPTLVRLAPNPARRVIGNLSDTARLLTLLDIQHSS